MGNIFIYLDMGVPQVVCTDCGNCGSVMGKSLCKMADTGCCHYFPEFTLIDIQRMAVLPGGLRALDIITANPDTVINKYSIYAMGPFDKEAYESYIASGELLEAGDIRDHTVFFKSCPFVIPGSGCKFPPRFRTVICNFFICEEILKRPELKDFQKVYMRERSKYTRWVYQESGELQRVLEKNNLNLISDFSESLRLLARLHKYYGYDFPALEPVAYSPAAGSDSNNEPIITSTQ